MIAGSVAANPGLTRRELHSIPVENRADCRFSRFRLQVATTTVLESFIDNARMAGFHLVYQKKPEYRAQGEKLLVKTINENLAFSGYRTLDAEALLKVIKRIQFSDS